MVHFYYILGGIIMKQIILNVHTTSLFDYDAEFNTYYDAIKEHSKKYRNYTLTNIEKTAFLPHMNIFIYKTYERYYNGILAQTYIDAFNSINFPFDFGLAPNSALTKEDFWFGYQYAKKFFKINHQFIFDENLEFDGFKLGEWYLKVDQQVFFSNIAFYLLDAISFDGKNQKLVDSQWKNMYALACEYRQTYGHLIIPNDYKVNGAELGVWLAYQRTRYKMNKLSQMAISLLETIDIQWTNPKNHKEIVCFGIVKKYYTDKGSIQKPYSDFEIAKSINYLASQKKSQKITPSIDTELSAMASDWFVDAAKYFEYAKDREKDPNFFSNGYAFMLGKYNIYGFPNLVDTFCKDWAKKICAYHQVNILTEEEYKQLALIDFDFDFDELLWRSGIYFLEDAIAKGKNIIHLFSKCSAYKGFALGMWLNTQAKYFNDSVLSNDKIDELKALGVDLEKLLNTKDIHFHVKRVLKYLNSENLSSENFSIEESIDIVRYAKVNGYLHRTTIKELDARNFEW